MRLVAAGIVVGTLAGAVTTRGLRSLLFDIPTFDPLTLGIVSGLLLAVAFVAGWLPARRAARIDPVIALRQE
jgi:ABC-type antimicrobial peptide transport system permease subunit